jgi:two-component system chemotaxis response regulator CheY
MAKVLIVDDAAFMRMMIKDILEKNDFEIVGEANNGIVAVDLYKKEKPDVVTMDITMPDMDGIEAVKQIKAFDPDAKVIMCSAMGQQSMVMDAIRAGAKDFIVKPFQADRVLEAIKNTCTILMYGGLNANSSIQIRRRTFCSRNRKSSKY